MALPQIGNISTTTITESRQEEKTYVQRQIKIKDGSFYAFAISSWLISLYILATLFAVI